MHMLRYCSAFLPLLLKYVPITGFDIFACTKALPKTHLSISDPLLSGPEITSFFNSLEADFTHFLNFWTLRLRLFYENAAIKVKLHITLYTSYNDRTNLHLFSATWRAYLKTWFNFGIDADITTSKYDISSTLLNLSNQFLIKSIKVLIVRDFGNTTYIDI